MKKIIDLSSHNTVLDWQKLKSDCDAIIIRLGYRGYGSGKICYDAKFNDYKQSLEYYDIPYGVYFFPCSINENEAQEEADFIINAVKDCHIKFPIYLDSEIADVKSGNGRADKLSKELRTSLLIAIASRVQAKGYKVGVYGSTSWLNTKLNMSRLIDLDVWVAQYATACTYKGKYSIWQYTSKGSVQGIKGNVDISKAIDIVFENVNPYPEPTRNLQKKIVAMRGDDVKWLQFELIRHECMSNVNSKGKSNIDGIFGKDTDASLRAFQRKANIKVDGICGAITRKHLKM